MMPLLQLLIFNSLKPDRFRIPLICLVKITVVHRQYAVSFPVISVFGRDIVKYYIHGYNIGGDSHRFSSTTFQVKIREASFTFI